METVKDCPKIKAGDIYFCRNPYKKSQTTSMQLDIMAGDRPMLVLSTRNNTCVCLPLTSKRKEMGQLYLKNTNHLAILSNEEYITPSKIVEIRYSNLTSYLGSISSEDLITINNIYPTMINAYIDSITIPVSINRIRPGLLILVGKSRYLILSVDDRTCIAIESSETYNPGCTHIIESRTMANETYLIAKYALYRFKIPRTFKVITAFSEMQTLNLLHQLLTSETIIHDVELDFEYTYEGNIQNDDDNVNNIIEPIVEKSDSDIMLYKNQLISKNINYYVKPRHKYIPCLLATPQKVLSKMETVSELIGFINRDSEEVKEEYGFNPSFLSGIYSTIANSIIPDEVNNELISAILNHNNKEKENEYKII